MTQFSPVQGQLLTPAKNVPPSGPLTALGQNLEDEGIRLNSLIFDSFENNVSTGENPGESGNDVSVFLGADFDLAKLADLPGATLHVQGGYFFGRVNNSVTRGWLQAASSVLAGLPFINRPRSYYLTRFSYEQTLCADRLDIEIGRINAKRAFDLPPPGNSLSTDDPVFAMDGGTSPAPYAHWGARARLTVTPRWSAGFGTYLVDTSENQTFGTDWRFDQASGALFVSNVVYQTDWSQSSYPSRFELVPFHNSSPVKDPLHPSALHTGVYGIASRLQQTIWRNKLSKSVVPQHVDLFGSVSYTPNPYVVAANNQEVGVTLFGLTPDAALDSITAKIDHLGLTQRAIEFERQARVAAGGPDVSTGTDEYRLELNAHVDLARGIGLEPVAEYIVNPDTSGNPNSAKVPRNGFVLALALIIHPNTVLGLPQS
ncbi:MAG TPA: carbohydrate porin [Acidocella sp.]|uniref:carbohydrate porin n=1 Tax=Acidocella sp. TaxID=50710 RepID=UPI002BA74D4F|nr:carbohydrate porin [Acidocella sp.]HVE23498.1 carbohydrate porin [Acidocella sp.]